MKKKKEKKRYQLIGATISIGYWPVDADEHEKWALGKQLDRLLRSQVLRHEMLAPVPGDVFEEVCRRFETQRLFGNPSLEARGHRGGCGGLEGQKRIG
jgi:hypothetical protein